jgi:hypothetical protein
MLMEFIQIEVIDGGYFLDPRRYLEVLPEIAEALPAGARTFAESEGHYDFYNLKCVKDLRLSEINLLDSSGALALEVSWAPSKLKHDSGLVVRYKGVISLSVEASRRAEEAETWPESKRLGDLQLDEILPHEAGCSHEMVMTDGVIKIVSADLDAEWR